LTDVSVTQTAVINRNLPTCATTVDSFSVSVLGLLMARITAWRWITITNGVRKRKYLAMGKSDLSGHHTYEVYNKHRRARWKPQ